MIMHAKYEASFSQSSKDIGQVKVDNRRQGKSNVKFPRSLRSHNFVMSSTLMLYIYILKNHFVAGTILAN